MRSKWKTLLSVAKQHWIVVLGVLAFILLSIWLLIEFLDYNIIEASALMSMIGGLILAALLFRLTNFPKQ